MSSDAQQPTQLSLTVTEQPAKLHRFRYLKEIKDGRMGSILHSRSSVKTPVKVRVTSDGGPPTADCRLRLVGCTVFEDLAPHPFYLFGDDCKAGVFQKEFTMSPAGSTEYDICLERIGIVCTPKKKAGKAKKSGEAAASPEEAAPDDSGYQWRLSELNFFKRPPRTNPFQGKDVNKLRMAFQLFVQLPDSKEWLPANSAPVFTAVVSDAKIYSEMTVEYVIPKTVTRLDQDVWLYTKDPLPVESASRFRVTAENEKSGASVAELPVKAVKKHLVVFNFSSLESIKGDWSLAVRVVDNETGDSSEPVNLNLCFPMDGPAEPASKKRRGERTNIANFETEDLLNDILVGFCTDQNSPDSEPEFQRSAGLILTQAGSLTESADDLVEVPVVHMITD